MTAPATDHAAAARTGSLPAIPRDTPRINPRADRRRTLYLAGLLPLLIALAFGLKVMTMRHHDHAGSAAWHTGNGTKALEEYAANGAVNLLQPWLAPFDSGDAAFLLADYPRARRLFASALDSVPHRQECTVRINLALTDEAIGDAAATEGRTDDATQAWRAGVGALDRGECPTDAGLGTGQSQDAAVVRERLEKKLDPPPSPPRQQRRGSGDQSRTQRQQGQRQQRQRHQLQQRNSAGSRDHRRAQDLDDYGGFNQSPTW